MIFENFDISSWKKSNIAEWYDWFHSLSQEEKKKKIGIECLRCKNGSVIVECSNCGGTDFRVLEKKIKCAKCEKAWSGIKCGKCNTENPFNENTVKFHNLPKKPLLKIIISKIWLPLLIIAIISILIKIGFDTEKENLNLDKKEKIKKIGKP